MKTLTAIVSIQGRVLGLLAKTTWLPILLLRLYLGYLFLELGWGKVHNLASMAERFQEWGIIWPNFNAALSSYTELICGALVLVGLFSRFASLPLAFNMVVATWVVKLPQVEDLSGFVELDEPLYALAFLLLAFLGPGLGSVDHWLWRWMSKRRPASRSPEPPPTHSDPVRA